MRSVLMDEHPCRIRAIIGISTEVAAAIDDDTFPACRGEPLGGDKPGKARTDDQEISGMIRVQVMKWVCMLPPVVALSGGRETK